jgi:hypothetical protein
VEWNDSCILDPFLPVYGVPLFDYQDHLTLRINTTLEREIYVLLSDADLKDINYSFKVLASAVEKNVQQMIDIDKDQWLESKSSIYNQDLLKSNKRVGGEEVIFQPRMVVETSIVVPSSANRTQATMAKVIQGNYPMRLKWVISYSIINRGVKDGRIACSEGELREISLAAGTGVSNYYKMEKGLDPLIVASQQDAVMLNNGRYDVPDVTPNTIEQQLSVDVQVLICDEYSQFFTGCTTGVMEYNITDFIIMEYSLISKDSKMHIRRSNVIIAGDKLYLCYDQLEQSSSLAEVVITYIGMMLSILFLIYLLITYGIFPQLRTLPGKMLIHLSCCLIVAQLLFMFGHTAFTISILCSLLGMVQHFAFLASFCWMHAIAINTIRTFTSPLARGASPDRIYKIYCAVTYGVPFAVFVVGAILEFCTDVGPLYGSRSCWIIHRIYMIVTFVLPIAAIIAANVVILLMAVMSIHRTKRATQSTVGRKSKGEFFIYTRLAFLMGLTWIFGFIAMFAHNDVIWYIFTLLNTSQGVFIGMSFGCNTRVRMFYEKRADKKRGLSTTGSSRQSTKMTTIGKTSS